MERLPVTRRIIQMLSRFPSGAAAVEHLRDALVKTVLLKAVGQQDGTASSVCGIRGIERSHVGWHTQ
jgi:hypothetical protein